MKLVLIVIIVMLVLLLWRPGMSFLAQKPADYRDTGPEFDIRQHLAGPAISEGIIYGPKGRVVSRFIAQMHGQWQGDTGTLSEEFTYSDGDTQAREWRLTMGQNGAFTAQADDIIGVAQGQHSGATVQLRYRLQLTEAAGGHVLDVVDWMYLMENGTILNRSEMRKFGIKVAELVATIRPQSAS